MKHGSVTGFKTNEAFTHNGVIKIALSRPRNDPVLVGRVSDITKQRNFHNEVYISEKGIEIDVKDYINEVFVLTQKQTGTLLSKDVVYNENAETNRGLTPRMYYFFELLIYDLHRMPRNRRETHRSY